MNRADSFTVALIAACPFPWPRGTPIRAYRIAESLAELGHSVHVMTYHLGKERPFPFEIHRIPDVPHYRKTSAGPSIRKITHLNPALTRLSRAVASRIDFDIVHAIHMEGLLVAKRAIPHLPIVYDAHTSLEGELPEYLSHLPRSLVGNVAARLDRIIPAKADFTIAVSRRLKDLLLDSHAVNNDAIAVIPNGVEYDLFNAPKKHSVENLQIIFTGNDAPYQGLDLLLDAFERLLVRRPEARLQLTGSSDFARERKLVEKLGLSRAVSISRSSFEEEVALLKRAAIAVSPRSNCDGVPQKILNYMAAGKAIVACEGSGETLRHGVTGLCVKNDDPQHMADALCRLIDSPLLASQLGEAARNEACSERSWHSVARQITDVYSHATDNACARIR